MTERAEKIETAYHVAIDGAAAEFAFARRDGVLHVLIDGQWQPVEFEYAGGATLQRVKVGKRVLSFGQRVTPDGIEIAIGGAVFQAQTKDARAVRYAGMVKKPAGAARVTIKAPMPGMIVTVPVKAGDRIAKDQTLVTLSAMKLENDIRSPAAGLIVSIGVAAGQAVEKGAVLAVVEQQAEG